MRARPCSHGVSSIHRHDPTHASTIVLVAARCLSRGGGRFCFCRRGEHASRCPPSPLRPRVDRGLPRPPGSIVLTASRQPAIDPSCRAQRRAGLVQVCVRVHADASHRASSSPAGTVERRASVRDAIANGDTEHAKVLVGRARLHAARVTNERDAEDLARNRVDARDAPHRALDPWQTTMCLRDEAECRCATHRDRAEVEATVHRLMLARAARARSHSANAGGVRRRCCALHTLMPGGVRPRPVPPPLHQCVDSRPG